MTEIIELGGTWRLGWQDARRGDQAFLGAPAQEQSTWFEVEVPGEVHRQLENAGVLEPIEPGLGALHAAWVEGATWYYVRDVDLPALQAGDRADLLFERLELGARVLVNGVEVANHHNAFLPLRVDIAAEIREGSNRITVELDGGAQHVADLPTKGYRRSIQQGPSKRHWIRASQSQFSWDWAPRLVTIGITEPARIELTRRAARIAAVVPVVSLADDHSAAHVRCRVILESCSEGAVRVSVAMPGLGITQEVEVVASVGELAAEVEFDVPDPELWWPIGMGAQALHELRVRSHDSRGAFDEQVRVIGLRTVEVDQSPVSDGTLFRLVVNGRSFFARGGNWVPLSLTPHPVDRALLDEQLDRAVEANFNFLRVWGGGDYESEEFYRGCDERGLLVWQDLIFACNRYPVDVDWFREEVVTEVTHQIRRLSSHASLALWAGDNENAWIGQGDSWPGPLVPAIDRVGTEDFARDHRFFEQDLAELVAREDPGHFYWPSSPWSPTDDDHNAGHEGDQHPWDVGFENADFRLYRTMEARFPNEGGILGPSTLPSVMASLPEGMRSYDSFAWKVHDNQTAQSFPARPMEAQLTAWTGRKIRELQLDEYVYFTGLLHGEALTEYIDNFRRRSATTGAAVFWMFNDCWPTVRSWTIVDSRGGRTPSFHPVRRAFQPLRVVVVGTDAGGADIIVINDTGAPQPVELEFGVSAYDGARPMQRIEIEVPVGPPVLAAQLSPPTDDPLTSLIIATMRIAGTVVSRSRLLPGPYAELPLRPAQVEVTQAPGAATFSSDVFVLGVCVDLDGGASAGDNFFDLFPGVPHTIRWQGDDPPRIHFTANDTIGSRP